MERSTPSVGVRWEVCCLRGLRVLLVTGTTSTPVLLVTGPNRGGVDTCWAMEGDPRGRQWQGSSSCFWPNLLCGPGIPTQLRFSASPSIKWARWGLLGRPPTPWGGSSEILKIRVRTAVATGEALHLLSHSTPPSSSQWVWRSQVYK